MAGILIRPNVAKNLPHGKPKHKDPKRPRPKTKVGGKTVFAKRTVSEESGKRRSMKSLPP